MNDQDHRHFVAPMLDRAPVLLALILAFTALSRGFLTESFWLDETVTCWVTGGGFSDVITRVTEYQGQSPLYYIIIWALRPVLGSSELALRLPSLVALAVSAALLYRIARYLFGVEAAGYSLLVLVTHDGFLRAMNARPYAAALLCAALSVWSLLRWMEVRGAGWWCGYVLATAAAMYLHYLFGLVLVIHLLCWALRPGRPPLWPFCGAMASIAVLLLPCLGQITLLAGRADSLVFSPQPNLAALVAVLLPVAPVVALVCGMLLAAVFFHKRKGLELRFTPIFLHSSWKMRLLWCWYLAPPLFFFLLAVLGKKYWFVERYFLWQAPAFAMLAGLVVSSFNPRQARSVLVAVLFAMLLLHEADRSWVVENWRGAVQQVRLEEGGQKLPVLLYSGLIEAENPEEYPEAGGYLMAPLEVYPVSNKVLLLPGRLIAHEKYFQKTVRPALDHAGKAFVIFMNRTVPGGEGSIEREFQAFFEKRGYSFVVDKERRLVKVALLRKR